MSLNVIGKDHPMFAELTQLVDTQLTERLKSGRRHTNYNILVQTLNETDVGGFITFQRSKNTLDVVRRNLQNRGLIPEVDFLLVPMEEEAAEGEEKITLCVVKRLSEKKGVPLEAAKRGPKAKAQAADAPQDAAAS